MKRFTIELSDEVHQYFKMLAALKGRSMKDLVAEKIEEVVEEEKKKGNIPEVKQQLNRTT